MIVRLGLSRVLGLLFDSRLLIWRSASNSHLNFGEGDLRQNDLFSSYKKYKIRCGPGGGNLFSKNQKITLITPIVLPFSVFASFVSWMMMMMRLCDETTFKYSWVNSPRTHSSHPIFALPCSVSLYKHVPAVKQIEW